MNEEWEKASKLFDRKIRYKKTGWVGVINGIWKHDYQGIIFNVRFDDSGLDDEWLARDEFDLLLIPAADQAPKPDKVYLFPNGNVAVFDAFGKQIPELQGGWINFDYLQWLAKIIVKENTRVINSGTLGIARNSLAQYMKHYQKTLFCKKCSHTEEEHNHEDGTGCHGIASYEKETNGYERCHCDEFICQNEI